MVDEEQVIIDKIVHEALEICQINEIESHCVYEVEKDPDDIPNTKRIIDEKVANLYSEKELSNHPKLAYALKYTNMITSSPYICLIHEPILNSVETIASMGLPYRNKIQLMINIAETLKYFHDQEICLRTLQSSTIVILKKSNEGYEISMTEIKNHEFLNAERVINKECKECNYQTAPEIVLKESHDLSADIWSLGAIFYEIYTSKKFPKKWNVPNSKQVGEFNLNFGNKSLKWMETCINKMINPSPQGRQKIKDILHLLKNAEVCLDWMEKIAS